MKKVLTLLLALVLTLSLAACGNKEDEENLADAVQKLSLDVTDVLAVTSDITLETEGLHGAVITWSSSNTDVIANDGKVTRPAIGAGNANVTLTATLTIGKEEITKDFALKVLEAVPVVVMDLARFNSSEVANGDIVEFTGIVTGTIDGKGFHVADASGFGYVYEGKEATVAIGDEVTVSGAKKTFYNIIELVDVTSVVVNSSNNDIPAFADTTIAAIYANDNTDSSIYNKMISFDGYVTVQGPSGKENAFLSWYTAELDLQQVEVYYKSGGDDKITAIKALDGKLANVDGIFMDYFSSAPAHYRISVNTPGEVTEGVALTDLEKANLTLAFTNLNIMSTTGIDYNLTLPTTSDYTGVDITWTTSDAAVITADGVVTQISGSDQTATLTASVNVNGVTATKVYSLTILDEDSSVPVTLTDALALADDTDVLVKAVVAGFNYANKPFFQDTDGTGIYLHQVVEGIAVGDEVIVRATMSSYNGIRQFKDLILVKVVSQDNVVFVNTTATPEEVGAKDAMPTTQNRLYKMELTVATLESGDYTLYTGDGTSFFSSYTSGSYLRDVLADGSKITYTFFVTGLAGDNIKMEIIDTELTTVQNLAAVKSMIAVSGNIFEDLELVTALEANDAVITWTSSDAAVAADGTVTRPAIGAEDTTVTLTASIVIGTEAAVEKTYTVVVLAAVEASTGSDLFISEYIEGSGNNKAIEIYNPTGDVVDLSSYSVTLNYGSGTVTVELTGTLASGEVVVYCNSQMDADTALVTECDSTLSYPTSFLTFNGDDTLQLSKSGIVIDQFGVDADAGGDDYAKNQVWVRNAAVVAGTDTFDQTEWTVVATDGVVDYLTIGSHTCDEPVVE
jgi:hypothetical protein